MIDTRFHFCIEPMALSELLRLSGHPELAESLTADPAIAGASDLTDATSQSISFAASRAYRQAVSESRSGVVLLAKDLADSTPQGGLSIVCDKPYDVFVDVLNVLYPDDTRNAGGKVQGDTQPLIEPGAVIGAKATIGAGAQIGSGTVIGPGAYIGPGVAIGRNCIIGANVTVECAYLGNEVVLQPGVVIGAEGFGFQLRPDRHRKIPQLGRVIVQDRVELGANTTVDRGTLGDTVIGEGSKIDNLVQIGHNCRIGRNCVISGMCGLSGSTVLEDGVVMGGGAGTAGHLTIGAGSTVLARSGVTHSFPAGSNIAGAPAQDVRMWKREIVAIRRAAKGDDR